MKTLAAVSIRQYQRAVVSLTEYDRSLELGAQVLLRERPEFIPASDEPVEGPHAAIVVGSDHGMCGPFNERIATFAGEQLRDLAGAGHPPHVIAVGRRVVPRLESAGIAVHASFSLPGSAAAIAGSVHEIVLRVDEWTAGQGSGRVVVVHNRPTSGAVYHEHLTRLLPLRARWLRMIQARPWPTKVLPTFTLDPAALFGALIRQFLYVSIYRALAESQAAENASRLAAMQGAEKNIDAYLDRLSVAYQRRRQDAVTAELSDIVAGYEAVKASGRRLVLSALPREKTAL